MTTVTHVPLYYLTRRISAPERPETLHLTHATLCAQIAATHHSRNDFAPLHQQPSSRVYEVKPVSPHSDQPILCNPTLQFRPDFAAIERAGAKEKTFKEKEKAKAKTLKFRILQSIRRKKRAFVSTCSAAPKFRAVTPRVVLHGAPELRDF